METGFFKWLWRFNALTIALAATGVIILLAIIAISEVLPMITRDSAHEVINIDNSASSEIEQTFYLGSFGETGAAGILSAPLMTVQEYDNGFSSSKTTRGNTINVLFINPESGESRWLITSGNALIRHYENIGRTIGPKDAKTHIQYATIYLLVTDDTSGDKRLSASDRADLMITAPDGSGFETLIPDVTAIEQTYALDDTTELLVFTNSAGKHMAHLDLVRRTITKTITLPVPQNTE